MRVPRLMNRARWSILFSLILLFILVLQDDSAIMQSPSEPMVQGITSAPIPTTSPIGSDRQIATLVRVVDGDTIRVEVNGRENTIRIIGLDTPESVDPRKPVECFAREATAELKRLLSDETIYLESDTSQGEQDKYGRLLRHVFTKQGQNVAREMIAHGYGHEYTYDDAYRYQSDFREAQASAESRLLGLWATDACINNVSNTQYLEPR